MEDIDGGLHPAVDGQSLDEDEVLNSQGLSVSFIFSPNPSEQDAEACFD